MSVNVLAPAVSVMTSAVIVVAMSGSSINRGLELMR